MFKFRSPKQSQVTDIVHCSIKRHAAFSSLFIDPGCLGYGLWQCS